MRSRLVNWIDARLPIKEAFRKHASQYPIPRNINIWWLFGSLSLLILVNQILTGLWLAMSYQPTVEQAFASIQEIMRNVEYGWLLRYLHVVGASAFFIVIYLHIFRGLLYGSYQKPRELVWLIGMAAFLVMMAEAFMGYLLPWGQMSYWGAQVITSLFSAVPVVGDSLANWIRGDFVVSGITLSRFFAFHVIGLPLILLLLVYLHIIALHQVGSNNPDGIETKLPKGTVQEPSRFTFHSSYTKDHDIVDCVPFYPYGVVKDLFGIGVFLILFSYILFFHPGLDGYFLEATNYVPADPMQTPEHIAPLWYFTPFYAVLRAVPDKLFGVFAMLMAVILLFFLPWIDRCSVRSFRYRSRLHRGNLLLFVVSFIALGILGSLPVTTLNTVLARIFSLCYFMFYVLLFFYSKREKTTPLPKRVTMK
ncbi:cytochrome b [Vibrio tritonius]|uniref:cytochrome b n=1 Tax=Vibrio tritonius TaxID=1435069 RepID=UPI00315DDA87